VRNLSFLAYKIRMMVCVMHAKDEDKGEEKEKGNSLQAQREITFIDTYAYTYRVNEIKRRPRNGS